jgi:hypothetical protein
MLLILLYKAEVFFMFQDSLQTAAAHHKVLESQLTDSIAIVEALSNNSLHCDAITGAAVLVRKPHLCFEIFTLLNVLISV